VSELESPILSLGALAETVASLRADGKRVTHARGMFDLLGRQEVERLRKAREGADALVVTIASDDSSRTPLLAPALRAQVVAALRFACGVAVEGDLPAGNVVDAVAADSVLEFEEDPRFRAQATQPNVLDATGRIDLVYPKPSPFTVEADAFLRDFRQRHSAADVIAAVHSLRKLRVLVVGDAIIDEYHFVRPLGMPLKSAIIASQFLEAEAYAGGALAVANHVAGFCDEVHLATVLGTKDTREDFVRAHLRPNVQPTFFYRNDAPTTVKRRYLLRFLVQKLFEIAFFDDHPLPPPVDADVVRHLEATCDGYDLVIASDFGHGMLSHQSIEMLCSRARFLAVNTQINSINFGYHVISKYRRADYVCIDEPELRLAMRDRITPVDHLLGPLADLVRAKMVTVTRGNQGSVTYRADGLRATIPIMSRQVVDTIGAGDAYLSASAPCACLGMSPELVGFIGNAIGGLAVRIVGNKEPVGPDTLLPFIKTLME
jgi:bifunctional ADP-heptose synthase (sugar kinase/adenylyltransferase)